MRIGIDARYAEDNFTGIGKYIFNLALNLSQKGNEVVLLYSKQPKQKIEGKNIYSKILFFRNKFLFEQLSLPIYLKKEKIDIYHAVGNLGVPVFSPCPSVLTVHDIIPLLVKDYFKFSPFGYFSKLSYLLRLKISLYFSLKVISVSEFTKRSLVEKLGVSEKKIKVIYNGVFVGKKKERLPSQIKKNRYILNHGGIDRRKNLYRLIKAFSIIVGEFPDYKLVITGKNYKLESNLLNLVKKLKINDSVLFTGYVKEEILWNLIRGAKCICFPSEIEGFGIPVLEGLAAGVPVVASNTSGIAEIAKETAVLINPYDISEIAKGIKKVLIDKNLRNNLIKEGLKRAKKFSWQKTVDEVLGVYKEILNCKAKR